MQTVFGTIFVDCNLQHTFIFSVYLVKSYGYTIFILVCAESFKSIGMQAYKASFCSKVYYVAFVNLLSLSFSQH